MKYCRENQRRSLIGCWLGDRELTLTILAFDIPS